MSNYCEYYLVEVDIPRSWLLVSIFRSFEHLSFDRTIDKQTGDFEFFVPLNNEPFFLEIIEYLQSIGVVKSFTKNENRLKHAAF